MEDASSILLRDRPRSVDSLEKFAVSAVLHEDVDAGVLADDFVDLCDVLVQQVLLKFDLSHDALQLVLVVLLNSADLDRHSLTGQFMRSLLDLSKSSLSDCFF